jgi:hypothetical protein
MMKQVISGLIAGGLVLFNCAQSNSPMSVVVADSMPLPSSSSAAMVAASAPPPQKLGRVTAPRASASAAPKCKLVPQTDARGIVSFERVCK